jgi:hypothetical protein
MVKGNLECRFLAPSANFSTMHFFPQFSALMLDGCRYEEFAAGGKIHPKLPLDFLWSSICK